MFADMRRIDRKIDKYECEQILSNAEYGTLATIGKNGYPYSTPLSFVYMDEAVYFHCAGTGEKLENIKFNHKVSFSVVGDTNVIPEKFTTKYESVILFGKASTADGTEKHNALLKIIEKYSPAFYRSGKEYVTKAADRTTIIKITVEHLSGKASK